MSQVARRLLVAALRLLPRRRRDLGAALLAEASMVPPGWRRLTWLAGGVWFVMKENATRTLGYGLGLLAAVAVVVGLDRIGTSDDSATVVLLALLVASALLGFAAPRWAWLTGLVIGAAIGLAHIVYTTLGPDLPHPSVPAGVGGAATLLVLVVPGIVGAYLGAGSAWLLRRSR
jgi:hypothetical protein